MRSNIQALLFCAALHPLSAQIPSLATTDDGSVVYFSTTLRPVGTTAGFAQKILSLRPG